MSILKSKIQPRSEGFKDNAQSMAALIQELRHIRQKIAQGGSPQARERHQSRGKLLPRERVERLLDPGSPFLELSPLAAYNL